MWMQNEKTKTFIRMKERLRKKMIESLRNVDLPYPNNEWVIRQ